MIWFAILGILLLLAPLLARRGQEHPQHRLPQMVAGIGLVSRAIGAVVRMLLVIVLAFLSLGRLIFWRDLRRW